MFLNSGGRYIRRFLSTIASFLRESHVIARIFGKTCRSEIAGNWLRFASYETLGRCIEDARVELHASLVATVTSTIE